MQRRSTVLLIVVAAALVVAAVPVLLHKRTAHIPAPAPSSPPAAQSSPSTPAAKPAPSGPVVRAKDPDNLVRLFFDYLKQENWRGAWACLSPDLQKKLGYRAFVAGFKGSHVTAYNPSALKIVGAGNFSLDVEVPYTLSGGSASGRYVATLRCVDLSGGGGPPDWKVQSLVMPPGQKP